jgi:MFS family permease
VARDRLQSATFARRAPHRHELLTHRCNRKESAVTVPSHPDRNAGAQPPPDGARARSDHDAGKGADKASIKPLRALNFTLADVQNGMGPYMALFLQSAVHWNPARIGIVLAIGNIAQVLTQTPVGALVDTLRAKRALLAVGIVMIALACTAIPLSPTFPVVGVSQALIGAAGAIFPPTLAAIALGMVGRKRLDAVLGGNQAWNAAGNVAAALGLGAVGLLVGLHWMFATIVALAAASLLILTRIDPGDIDYEMARGGDGRDQCASSDADQGPLQAFKGLLPAFRDLIRQRGVATFLTCAVIFHFANAAMVPLVTEMLAKDQGVRKAIMYTSGYMVASQAVFVVVAAFAGKLAGKAGRKPLFLFAFAALCLRGLLYSVCDTPAALIAVQCMDGLGAGVFGVVGTLIIADLTRGTGRFNAAQGAVAAAVGIGALLSNSVAGFMAHHAGNTPTFLMLAAIAAAGFLLFAFRMPETLDRDDGQAGTPPDGDKAQAQTSSC